MRGLTLKLFFHLLLCLFVFLFLKLIVFRIHTSVPPTFVDRLQILFRLGILPLIIGFFDPSIQDVAMLFKLVCILRVVGEVIYLVRIFADIIKFFSGPFPKESGFSSLF